MGKNGRKIAVDHQRELCHKSLVRKSKSAGRTYPHIPFRPTRLQERRLRALAEASDQSMGEIIRECVAAHLPHLERAQRITP